MFANSHRKKKNHHTQLQQQLQPIMRHLLHTTHVYNQANDSNTKAHLLEKIFCTFDRPCEEMLFNTMR